VNRLYRYFMDKQWAMAVAGLLAVLTVAQEQIELLPTGETQGWIMAAVTLALGVVTRARVWSTATVDAIEKVSG